MKEKKKKKKLLIEISVITMSILFFTLVYIAVSDFFFTMNICLTSDEEMIESNLKKFNTATSQIHDLEGFVNYIGAHHDELIVPPTLQEQEDYNSGKYDDALEHFYTDDNFRLDEQTPEEQLYLTRSFIDLIKSEFTHVMKVYDDDMVRMMQLIDDQSYLLLIENDSPDEKSLRYGTVMEYDISEHNAIKQILNGKLNAPGKVVFEQYTSPDTGQYFYNGYMNIFIDGKPLFTIEYQDNLTEFHKDVLKRIAFSFLIRFAGVILLHLLLLFFIYKKAISPLSKVERSVQKYKENKNTNETVEDLKKIKSNNEVGVLAESISDMALELDSYINEIRSATAEKERIKTELALATKIQLSALPNKYPAFPDHSEFDLYAVMKPAKEVGGDFYDFFLIDEDHLALVIGDVSDKGVPAALFMMMSKNRIKHISSGNSPAAILTKVNLSIEEENDNLMFVSVWLGILEISTGKMICSNAGHEYPAIKKAGGAFELLEDDHGLPIGLYDDSAYTDYEIELKKGDVVFVYTDGVPEAATTERKQFGIDRMLETLNNNSDAAPQDFLKSVNTAVDDFTGGASQFDDLTMLCLKYYGSE